MSIWTQLLFLHGHIATPTALALIAPACARRAAGPAAQDAASTAAPATPAAAPAPQAAAATGEPSHHPLRAVGQLR